MLLHKQHPGAGESSTRFDSHSDAMTETPTLSADMAFLVLQDIVHLSCFALIIQLPLLVPYMLKAYERSQSAHEVNLKLCDTLAFAAPPGLPPLLMLVGFMARRRSKSTVCS